MLKVADDVAVLVTAIFVTTVVVDEFGTVYRVVLLVAAAVLASAYDVTAMSYCILFQQMSMISPIIIESVSNTAQEAVDPSVVKYFPVCPVCDGTT